MHHKPELYILAGGLLFPSLPSLAQTVSLIEKCKPNGRGYRFCEFAPVVLSEPLRPKTEWVWDKSQAYETNFLIRYTLACNGNQTGIVWEAGANKVSLQYSTATEPVRQAEVTGVSLLSLSDQNATQTRMAQLFGECKVVVQSLERKLSLAMLERFRSEAEYQAQIVDLNTKLLDQIKLLTRTTEYTVDRLSLLRDTVRDALEFEDADPQLQIFLALVEVVLGDESDQESLVKLKEIMPEIEQSQTNELQRQQTIAVQMQERVSLVAKVP